MASNRNKSLGSILVIVVLIVLVLGKKCLWDRNSPNVNNDNIRASLIQHKLSYTKHAKCRMDCRDISSEEVEHVLETGNINTNKSEEGQGQCPTYAFEGKTMDGQTIRVIFGNCPKTTKVITCIDLNQEHQCDCP